MMSMHLIHINNQILREISGRGRTRRVSNGPSYIQKGRGGEDGTAEIFKDYMNDYKGLDIYRETVDGQYFNEWNYEDGCPPWMQKMYEVTGDDFTGEYIIRFMDPYVKGKTGKSRVMY